MSYVREGQGRKPMRLSGGSRAIGQEQGYFHNDVELGEIESQDLGGGERHLGV